MNIIKIIGIVLIAAGLAGLVYGQFSYPKETQEAKIGSLELSIQETQTVSIPAWAGIAAVLAGCGLLVFPNKQA